MAQVKIINGDLLEAFAGGTVSAIAHSCNCFCVFGAGLAKAIRNKYPQAYEADKLTPYGDPKKLGQFSLCSEREKQYILNLYCQYKYGSGKRFTDYDAVLLAFENVRAWMGKMELKTLGLPFNFGCGLGGGEWSVVFGCIKYVFENSDVNVTIFKIE